MKKNKPYIKHENIRCYNCDNDELKLNQNYCGSCGYELDWDDFGGYMLSVSQLNMMKHMTGINRGKKMYRNHYTDNSASDDMLHLQAIGFGIVKKDGKGVVFFLTKKGRKFISKMFGVKDEIDQ